jgi:hypothetical protein
MNARELVDHIRSGPEILNLDEPLRFRRRTRSNPCDFNEFLEALQSSKTIRDVRCRSQLRLSITEDEWILLVKTLGSIKDLQRLKFYCAPGSRRFRPFQAVADAVNNAQSLCRLKLTMEGATFPRDPQRLVALADALRQHTTLKKFTWVDCLEAFRDLSPDVVLRALPECPHLQEVAILTKYASADAMKNLLLQLTSTTKLHLVLEMDQLLAAADEIRLGHCSKTLTLTMPSATRSEATEAFKVLASTIQLICNLKRLNLSVVGSGPTDEAFVGLAEALTVNTTLRMIGLFRTVHGFQSYEAFAKMLRVNTSLILELPQVPLGSGERIFESFGQMRIEQRLNRVGRKRLLASSQTTKEEWVDALHEMSSDDTDDDPDALRISCIFSLFRLNPEVVSMS